MTRTLLPSIGRFPRPLARFEREIEDLWERVFGEGDGWLIERGEFVPMVNLSETEESLEVTVELPGLKPEDFNVEVKEGHLWISGEKKEEKEEKGKTFHRIERRYGEFRRVIPLPAAVDEEKIEARFTDGVLRVMVPKSEGAKPKHIEVKT